MIKNYGQNGAWAYTWTAKIYGMLPIISGTLKSVNFKFGRNIHRLNPSKRPLKILETRGRGRSHGLSKIFRAAIYRAHRAVVFEIAQLSCIDVRQHRPICRARYNAIARPSVRLSVCPSATRVD